MKILKYLLYTAIILAVLVVALGFFAKKTYHIERSIEIDAPKSLVFESVSQFKNLNKWSPWNELDPKMTKTYTGTDGQVGATFSWSGNKDVGSGKQTIQAVGPDRVDMLLNIGAPFKADFPASFIVTGDTLKSKVTWTLDPVLPFPINVWAMFTNVDKAMGKDYERGLGNLKKYCEHIVHPTYNGYEVVEKELPLQVYLGFRAKVDTAEIQDFYAENLPKVLAAFNKAMLVPSGHPSGLFWTWEKGSSDMAATIPVADEKVKLDSVEAFPVGGGLALIVEYFGPYAASQEAHFAMDEYMLEKKLEHIPPIIEEYITDPMTEPDTAKWLTKVIYFVRPKVDTLQ